MLSKNTRTKLLEEFRKIAISSYPKIDADIEAVIILSGESREPKIKTRLNDTDERLNEGIEILKKIEGLGGKPILVLDGTEDQNRWMVKITKNKNIKKIKLVENPDYPNASTLTQIEGIHKLPFKKVAIISHVYHGPRLFRYVQKYLSDKEVKIFLLNRGRINKKDVDEEIGKIIEYSNRGDIELTRPRIVAIIQARMTSTRLPGKVMMKIAGKPMLWYVFKRTQWSQLVNDIIVATSKNKSDDVIVNFCRENKIDYFRGNLNNVLSRYYNAAKKTGAEVIVRVTSDCPLIDGHLIDEGIEMFKNSQVDYLSNTTKRTFPRGLDFEIFTFKVLKEAYLKAKDKPEREHVTPYIYNSDRFKIDNLKQKLDKSKYRITVDTIEDFKVIKVLIEKYRAEKKGYSKIIAILDSHPEITAINLKVNQKKYSE